MLSTERLVRSARFWSRCSLSLVIERAKSTGMEVNRRLHIEGDHDFMAGDGMLFYLLCKNRTVLYCEGVFP